MLEVYRDTEIMTNACLDFPRAMWKKIYDRQSWHLNVDPFVKKEELYEFFFQAQNVNKYLLEIFQSKSARVWTPLRMYNLFS